jgi:hypothetical protein
MPDYGALITEQSELNGCSITPATLASSYTDAIDLSRARRWLTELVVPTLSSSTVNFGLYWSATSSGTYVAVTGTSITAETTGNKVFQIETTTDAITNFASGAKWMKGYTLVTTGSAGNVGCTVRGFTLRFAPGSDQATLAQAPKVL